MSDPSEEGLYSEAHSFAFSAKTPLDVIKEFLTYCVHEFGTFLATSIALWAMAEVVSAATNQQTSVESLAVPVLATAAVAATYQAYRNQKAYVPEALVSESSAVKDIYRTQKFGWNAALSRQMLLDRISKAEATLDRIKRGAQYVEPRSIERMEYMTWLETRPEAARRLVRAAMMLVTSKLPIAIGGTTSEEDLGPLKNEIDALAALYEAALDMEVECHEIIPPQELLSLHEMTHGWTDTTRQGVREFCDVLETLANLDRKAVARSETSPPTFNITVDAPDNLGEFNRRLDALTG